MQKITLIKYGASFRSIQSKSYLIRNKYTQGITDRANGFRLIIKEKEYENM